MERVEECLRSTRFSTSEMKFVPVQLIVAGEAQPLQFRVARFLTTEESVASTGGAGGGGGGCDHMVTLGDLLAAWVPDYPLPDSGAANTVVRNGACLDLGLWPGWYCCPVGDGGGSTRSQCRGEGRQRRLRSTQTNGEEMGTAVGCTLLWRS
jgi:hypothetical protein